MTNWNRRPDIQKNRSHWGLTLEDHTNPTWEYYKSIICILLLVEFFLFLTAVIFGRRLGHEFVAPICFWLGVIVAAVFVTIVIANLMVVFFFGRYRRIRKGT
jgi:hypothetical protein